MCTCNNKIANVIIDHNFHEFEYLTQHTVLFLQFLPAFRVRRLRIPSSAYVVYTMTKIQIDLEPEVF